MPNCLSSKFNKQKVSTEPAERGFSLVELLVVMGIIAILLGLGANALLTFRRNRQVDTLAYSVRDMIKDARGKSLAVTTEQAGGKFPLAYVVDLSSTDSIQTKIIYGLSETHSSWEGSVPVGAVTETITTRENLIVDVSKGCDKVLFESVNGRMHIYQGDYVTESEDCSITFELPGYSRELVLNSSEKRFEVK